MVLRCQHYVWLLIRILKLSFTYTCDEVFGQSIAADDGINYQNKEPIHLWLKKLSTNIQF